MHLQMCYLAKHADEIENLLNKNLPDTSRHSIRAKPYRAQVDGHNYVNAKLRKNVVSYEQAKMWFDTTIASTIKTRGADAGHSFSNFRNLHAALRVMHKKKIEKSEPKKN